MPFGKRFGSWTLPSLHQKYANANCCCHLANKNEELRWWRQQFRLLPNYSGLVWCSIGHVWQTNRQAGGGRTERRTSRVIRLTGRAYITMRNAWVGSATCWYVSARWWSGVAWRLCKRSLLEVQTLLLLLLLTWCAWMKMNYRKWSVLLPL